MTTSTSRRALSRAIKSTLHRMACFDQPRYRLLPAVRVSFPAWRNSNSASFSAARCSKSRWWTNLPAPARSKCCTCRTASRPKATPTIVVASQFEERPDGMSITDFIKSLVSGPITTLFRFRRQVPSSPSRSPEIRTLAVSESGRFHHRLRLRLRWRSQMSNLHST